MNGLKKIIIYIIIIFVIYQIGTTYDIKNISVFVTYVFIILFCIYGLLCNKVNFGLSQIFFSFCLFFLGIAPLIQYFEDIVFWDGAFFTEQDYLKTNMLIILALIIYSIVYRFSLKLKHKHYHVHNTSLRSDNSSSVHNHRLVLLSTISSLYIFFVICQGNLIGMLIRVDAESDGMNNVIGLINSFFIRPVPAICFLLFKFYDKKSKLVEFYLLFLLLVTNSPTAIPRFAVAAFYIPLVMVYFKKVLYKKYNLTILVIVSLVLVFPILNLVRFPDQSFSVSRFYLPLLEGHFDSYQMFMRVVSLDYITYGRQLLGVILFWIPRSLWASKPIGSGYLIAHEYGLSFDNISMNFFGEGYINFGIIGVCIFSIILARFNAYMDCRYWLKSGHNDRYFSLAFAICLGMEFTVMRGALLNIFPVLISYILSLTCIHKISLYRQ